MSVKPASCARVRGGRGLGLWGGAAGDGARLGAGSRWPGWAPRGGGSRRSRSPGRACSSITRSRRTCGRCGQPGGLSKGLWAGRRAVQEGCGQVVGGWAERSECPAVHQLSMVLVRPGTVHGSGVAGGVPVIAPARPTWEVRSADEGLRAGLRSGEGPEPTLRALGWPRTRLRGRRDHHPLASCGPVPTPSTTATGSTSASDATDRCASVGGATGATATAARGARRRRGGRACDGPGGATSAASEGARTTPRASSATSNAAQGR